MEYAVVIEPTATGFSAYVPDVLGCVAAGETEAEVIALMHEALEFHFEAIHADGELIPQPASRLDYVDVVQSTSRSRSDAGGGMCRYAIVIERGPTSFGAYVPDLPGCVAVGDNEAEVKKLIRKGIRLHLEQLQLHGEPIPKPTSRIAHVEVTPAASVA